jgi:hypothetical protein
MRPGIERSGPYFFAQNQVFEDFIDTYDKEADNIPVDF